MDVINYHSKYKKLNKKKIEKKLVLGTFIFFWIFHYWYVGPYFLGWIDWGGKKSNGNIIRMATCFFSLMMVIILV
jgi:hypothetical protein